MFTCRLLVIFIVSFLLLSPVVKYLKIYFDKPLIIVAQDNSESINKGLKSDNYTQQLTRFFNALEKDFEFKSFLFGEDIKDERLATFKDKETNFDPLFDHIKDKYTNNNIGALILISDGIYNKGTNPVYRSKDVPYPVYTVTVGDTSRNKDIILKSVYSNKIAFAGDFFQ
jgi:hypothetical protein